MTNEAASTATLIPFDRVFQLSAKELNEDYRVNLFDRINQGNYELLEMFGEPEGEAEIEDGGAEGTEGDDEDIEKHDDEEIEKYHDEEKFNGKKKKRKLSKKTKELEYDLDDPFIDDSEITDVYQSVFELMRSGGGGGQSEETDQIEGNPKSNSKTDNDENEKIKNINKKSRNFFVYRGTMTTEILSKEFEIDVNELMEVEAAAAAAAAASAIEDEDGNFNNDSGDEIIRKKRVKRGNDDKQPSSKRQKTPKPPKDPKPPKPSKESKDPKSPKKSKVNDLINQSAKKFNDIFSSDDAVIGAPVFNVTGVDSNLLELREVLKRFRDSAVGTPFSPGKFPSALRPKLNETLFAILRFCRPSLQSPLPSRFFPALASFLPFSPAALNKLLTRKILGPLIESMEKVEIPKLYSNWEVIIKKRIKEDGSIIIISTEEPANTANSTTNTVNTPIVASVGSPLKKKLKFNEEMRQQIFEILRTEIDLNNLIILSNTFEAANNTGNIVKIAQSELNLRKNVYQKMANYSIDSDSKSERELDSTNPSNLLLLLSSTEISKEFGAQKRKHEKRISKCASEILFGESEIEDFLKELDIPKEGKSSVVIVTEPVMNTSLPEPPIDPLNLFANEIIPEGNNCASSSSLFIDSNN